MAVVTTNYVRRGKIGNAKIKDNILHTARFARFHELKSLHGQGNTLYNETSLLLGASLSKHILRVAPTPTRPELGNCLVVAPTRGGKGLLAVSQLLTYPHSVVVNDVKGDLFQQTAGYRARLGKVFVIDPEGYGHRYDPLLGKQSEHHLQSQATNLLHKANEGEGEIFTQRAIVQLTQLFLAARREKQQPLPYVNTMIRSGMGRVVKRLNEIDPRLATRFLFAETESANLDDRFLLSTWGTLSAKMSLLLTEENVRCFAGSDFTAKDIMCADKPLSIYFRLPERDLLALTPLIRLMWGSLIDELITVYDKAGGKNCRPVLLLIDEAGRTPIPSLSDQATTVVGRRISLWVAIQSLSQLEVSYGKAHSKVILDNMESQLFYRPSNLETADHLAHALGRRSGLAHSQTIREGVQTSEGLSEQGVPLLTSWEIKQMRDEDIIGFHRLIPPFRARRMDWRQFPVLRQRQTILPPKLQKLPPLQTQGNHEGIIWQRKKKTYLDPDAIN